MYEFSIGNGTENRYYTFVDLSKNQIKLLHDEIFGQTVVNKVSITICRNIYCYRFNNKNYAE